MNISRIRRHAFSAVALATASLLVAGCSGGGASRATPATKSQASAQRVPFKIRFGAPGTSSTKRSPRFVSRGTTILGLAVSGGTGSANASNTAEVYYNVAPGSPNCGGNTGARTCTVFLNVSPDANVTFAFQLFGDTVANPTTDVTVGTTPTQTLAQASTTATVTAGAPNVVSVTMEGTPASATISPIGYVAENAAITVPLTIHIFDASGAEIVTDSGNAQDVYDSSVPVHLALGEASNFNATPVHVTLSQNSAPLTSPVLLTTQQAGQGISLVYDGQGTGTYDAEAKVIIGTTGAAQAALLAVALSPDELTFSSGGGPATFSIVSPQFVPAANYIIDSSTCPGPVVASVVDNTNDTFTVTPGNGVGACSVNLNFSGSGVFTPFTLSVDVLVLM